jgi:hypothetical protein
MASIAAIERYPIMGLALFCMIENDLMVNEKKLSVRFINYHAKHAENNMQLFVFKNTVLMLTVMRV